MTPGEALGELLEHGLRGHWCVRDREGTRTWVCVRCGERIPFNIGGDP